MKGLLKYIFGALTVGSTSLSYAQQTNPDTSNSSVSESYSDRPVDEWWTVFKDPLLDSLEKTGLANNLDLQEVVSRVEEARTRVKVAESYWYPSVRLTPYIAKQSLAPNRPTTIQLQEGQVLNRYMLNTYQVPLDVSYEVDIWHKVKNQVLTSQQLAEATEAEYKAAQLTITTEIARIYLLLQSVDTERQVLQQSIGLRDSTLQIVRARYTAGLVSQMDVQRADTEVANTKFQLEALNRSRMEVSMSLAVLLGVSPTDFKIRQGSLPVFLPHVPATAPTDLIYRRPDLMQTERMVAAANSQVEVAKTAVLPRFNLIGSVGLTSRELSPLLNQNSGTYLLGGTISVPVFEGFRNKNNIVIAQQQVQTLNATYQKRILTAVQEAETALANLQQLSQQAVIQQQALESAQKTRQYARELYVKGLTSFLEAVDAERTALELERQSVNLKGQQLLYTVAYIKALGGSW
ncbi:efflux transporter outer membrane subunit [Pontibacter silvestris]|uniref:Efflux transporter outer membrane subunit n=1 Tax=Pontibacter silvestris TaxID=2305183 RepID=A0ABW4WZ87_9BACT|nr:efflux transporter outer membrane subunit [Pontibacter silvestris]MCC9135391.1 efflux transporter outer membrane subunit [Pontibacter silvestris]